MKINRLMLILLFTLGFALFTFGQQEQKQKLDLKSVKKVQFAKLSPDLTVSFLSKRTFTKNSRMLKGQKGYPVKVKNTGKATAKNFFVDYFLSTDRTPSLVQPVYSARYSEDVLLKGGRFHIKSLAPGASKTLSFTPSNFPSNLVTKSKYYIGVFVDSQRAVAELSEINNFDWRDFTIYPAHINTIGQMHPMNSNNFTYSMALVLSGTGFDVNNLAGKTVQMGPYTLNLHPLEYYNPGRLEAIIPSNVAFGEEYNVYLKKNNIRISNIKKHLLKISGEGCFLLGQDVQEGPAGCTIRMFGNYFGSTQGSFIVKFGSVTATVSSWSNNQINIICPNVSPGNYTIFLEKNGQNVMLSVSDWGWTVTAN